MWIGLAERAFQAERQPVQRPEVEGVCEEEQRRPGELVESR